MLRMNRFGGNKPKKLQNYFWLQMSARFASRSDGRELVSALGQGWFGKYVAYLQLFPSYPMANTIYISEGAPNFS